MMAGNPAIPRVTTLRVAAADQSAEFSFDTSGKNTTSNTEWVTNTWTFTANAATTVLEIYSTDRQSDREGPALDNVSVIQKNR